MLAMNSGYDEQSEDKNDSQMSSSGLSQQAEQLIMELENMHGESKAKVLELVETLRHDGLKDHQIKKILLERVKFISRSALYEYMPPKLKRGYTKPKPLPKTINISTPHKVIEQQPPPDAEEYIGSPEQEIKKIGEIRRDLANEDEDPKDLEIQFLKEKVAELEDALKKTEQFKPATQFQETKVSLKDPKGLIEKAVMTEETVFDWLAKRDNKVTNFYFGNTGIEFFKRQIFGNLQGSGVKVFKRLYFEV